MNYEMMGDVASDLKAVLIGAGFSETPLEMQAEMNAAQYDTGLAQFAPTVPMTQEAVFVNNLSQVPAYIEITKMGSTHDSGPNRKRTYTVAQYTADASLKGMYARNELETDWFTTTTKGNLWDSWYYINNVAVRTLVCNKNAYFYNLSHRVADVKEYLQMLMLYRGAGINLRKTLPIAQIDPLHPQVSNTFSGGIGRRVLWETAMSAISPDEEWETSYENYSSTIPGNDLMLGIHAPLPAAGGGDAVLPLAGGDRLAYERAVKMFYEVVFTKYVKEALDVLEMSTQTSESMVRTLFSNAVNKYLGEVGIAVNGSMPLTVEIYASIEQAQKTQNANPTDRFIVNCSIPNDPSFTDGPPIIWDKGEYHITPMKHPITGQVIFDGMDVKNGDPLTCQLALQYLKRLAFIPLENQLSKLAGTKANLEDPNAVLKAGAAQLDPYRNLSLVYDPKASATAGSTVFRDVALSTASRRELPQLVVGAPGTPDAKYFNMTDQLIYDAFRTYSLDEGGDISAEELKQKGVIAKKGSIVPWLIGGLAAGLIAMQAM